MQKSFAFAGDTHVGETVSRKLQDAGYVLAAGLASADYIFTYCLTQSQLEDVYLGTGGAVEQAKEGCCLVDLSPSTCTLAKEIYAVARVNELQAVDAPLVLKDPCAHDAFGDAANVMALAGGEDDAVADVEPLLSAFAGTVMRAGLPGSGQLAKAVATAQQASALVALVEAHAIGKAQGDTARTGLAAAAAAGFVPPQALAIYEAMEEGHFHGTYSCRVLLAELSAVLNGAEEVDLVLAQVEACQHIAELFVVVGGGDLPAHALALAYASDEEGAPYGLDWARANDLYGQEHDHDHGHEHHGHADDEGYAYDEYGYEYGFEDDEDGYGAFGGFSSN